MQLCDVRFGSLAALFPHSSPMSASEGKADVFRFNFGSLGPNVRFSPKRTLLPRRNSDFQGPLSATSGRSGINIIVGLSVAKELSATKLFSIHI